MSFGTVSKAISLACNISRNHQETMTESIPASRLVHDHVPVEIRNPFLFQFYTLFRVTTSFQIFCFVGDI